MRRRSREQKHVVMSVAGPLGSEGGGRGGGWAAGISPGDPWPPVVS